MDAWLWVTNAVMFGIVGLMGWAIFSADRKRHRNRHKD